MKKFYMNTVQETEEILKTDIKNGLNSAEADKRLRKNGKNEFLEEKTRGIISKFCSQLNDFLIVVLICAAVISFIVGIAQGQKDVTEPVIILLIVVLNAVIGVVQENRAEKSLKMLKKMSAPEALVLRDGKETKIPAREVVRGDILIVGAGDIVAADARVVDCVKMCIDESAMTGETNPVNKVCEKIDDENVALADRTNMIFSSTSVVSGHGKAIVTETGMGTEVGKVAGLILSSKTPQTPLQKRMATFGKKMGIIAICICAVVFITGIIRGYSPLFMFITSVSLAVAAIPEGLLAIVTIMLAIGVSDMARRRALIRHLPSVETLGSAEVICTDKTGTVTENKMTVTKVYSENILYMCKMVSNCCDKNTHNPTENAILKYSGDALVDLPEFFREKEIPFSSKIKKMAVLCRDGKERYVISKGAAEVLLPECTRIYNGKEDVLLSFSKKREIEKKLNEMADEGLRVIAVTYKKTKLKAITEENMVFLGLIGIEDPPRKEALSAVEECKRAGIIPVMITGDHKKTALAIAKKIGIYEEGKKAVLGKDLDKISDEELDKTIENICVFARVSPEHKVRIVEAWQRKGKVVAMTGDGVNDAPALKKADIGCSLGIAGTDVAKSASDMILTDDNFATVVEAIRHGRLIFKNIKKTVKFLLSSNTGEIVTIFFGMLMGFEPPLLAIQLLWVNLVTDSLPAIALGVDKEDKDLMREPPTTENFVTRSEMSGILLEGAVIGMLSLLAFCIGKFRYCDLTVARTMAFSALSISQLIHSFNVRSEKSVFHSGALKNKLLTFSAVLGIFLQICVVEIPVLASIFKVCGLSIGCWGIVAVLSVTPLILMEIQKKLNSIVKKNRKKTKKS